MVFIYLVMDFPNNPDSVLSADILMAIIVSEIILQIHLQLLVLEYMSIGPSGVRTFLTGIDFNH